MIKIKFRGQQIETKEWRYGYLSKRSEYNTIREQELKDSAYHTYDVFHDTVSQYTGRNDKNGKEIYVGDIMGKGPLTCIVKQREDGAYILQFLDPIMKGIDISILDPKVANSEITGNIHEFPELLTKLKTES
ncbi:YopX family protein [Chryseobacterium arthrosphaerae]|uniref:YopX family protein n=1 Tax=Chryseobacterium arthrosphaerae TaxID=651561 RepID=UPI003D34D6C6